MLTHGNKAILNFIHLLFGAMDKYDVKFVLRVPLAEHVTSSVHPGATRAASDGVADKPAKEGPPRGFRELREALKILQSLKNMTVEQLWTGGSPTSLTSVEAAAAILANGSAGGSTPAGPEKPTKEQRFLDDIKKLQENLKKTLDNVAIVEEEKMEAVVEAGGGAGRGGGTAAAEVRCFQQRHLLTTPIVNE